MPPFVKEISGVLVRLTTCKRLTNSLPKLSLITLVPHARRSIGQGTFWRKKCNPSYSGMTLCCVTDGATYPREPPRIFGVVRKIIRRSRGPTRKVIDNLPEKAILLPYWGRKPPCSLQVVSAFPRSRQANMTPVHRDSALLRTDSTMIAPSKTSDFLQRTFHMTARHEQESYDKKYIFVKFHVCKGPSNGIIEVGKGHRIPGDTTGSWFQNQRFR